MAEFEAAIYVADALPAGLIFEVAVGPTTTGDGRKELWQSDGTAAGTQEIAQWSNRADGCTWINLPPRSANSSVLFSVQTSCEPDAELWISDGSAERTRRLRTFTGGAPGVAEGGIRYRGELYFLASAGNPGTGPPQISIWKSDGTPQGTVAVAELPTSDGGGDWSPQGTAAGAEGIYFSWADPEHGVELWRTDGTAAGTVAGRRSGAVHRLDRRDGPGALAGGRGSRSAAAGRRSLPGSGELRAGRAFRRRRRLLLRRRRRPCRA